MLADVGEGVLVVDVPLAISRGRSILPNCFRRVGGADTLLGSLGSIGERLANERLVLSRPRYATNVPSVPGVAVKVANAIDELVAGSGALQKADTIISARHSEPRLIALGCDVCVPARAFANDVDVARGNRSTRSEI